MGTNTARMIADEAPLATVVGYAALTEAMRIAGGQSALATAVGKKQGHVLDWLTSTGAPADICPAIEHTTNEQVKCEDLRPDLHWVRGDSDEILGYLTPVDNADPQYIRASLMVEVRKQFARTVEDPITWLPEGFLQGGTLSTTDGQFNSQNGVYVPRGTCFQDIAADAARLMNGAGELLSEFSHALPSDGSWCAWQLFELAGHALRYLREAGHFAKLDTQQTRLAYLRGILHRLEPEQRKEIEDFYKFGSLIDTPRLTDESAFIDFADEIDGSARANDHEHFYTHAYGITHGIESDELRDHLIAKHGFRTFDGTPFPGRAPELDALHAEVQSIVGSRNHVAAADPLTGRLGSDTESVAFPAGWPKSRADLSFTKSEDSGRINSNWNVLRDPDGYDGDGRRIGQMYFGETLQLATYSPVAAMQAIRFAPTAREWKNGNGQEDAFMECVSRYAMAAALAFPTGIPADFDAQRMEHEEWGREKAVGAAQAMAANNKRRDRRVAAKKRDRAA